MDYGKPFKTTKKHWENCRLILEGLGLGQLWFTENAVWSLDGVLAVIFHTAWQFGALGDLNFSM